MSLIHTTDGEDRMGVNEREHGQTMAEYAVVLGVISVSVILAIMLLSDSVANALLRAVDLIN